MKKNTLVAYSLSFIAACLFFKFTILPVFAQYTCNLGGSLDAKCTNGSISDLNIGVKNIFSWFQSIGGDMRMDNGFTDHLPSGKYAAAVNSAGNGGIIFTGTQDAETDGGIPSHIGVVGGNTNTEPYASPNTFLRASYTHEQALANQNGITPTSLPVKCESSATPCVITTDIPNHGIYQDTSGSAVYLTTSTIPATGITVGNYIILVKGDIHIKGRIRVYAGSTLSIFSQGNIIVENTVGETPGVTCNTASSAVLNGCTIEGFYSTEKNFTLNTKATCPSVYDNRLNIAGAVVVNAALDTVLPYSLVNHRSLCATYDPLYPSLVITERPDFILNAPQLIQSQNSYTQEVNP